MKYFYGCVYDIFKDRKYPTEEHSDSVTSNLRLSDYIASGFNSLPSIHMKLLFFREKGRPFSISFKCGSGVFANNQRHRKGRCNTDDQ